MFYLSIIMSSFKYNYIFCVPVGYVNESHTETLGVYKSDYWIVNLLCEHCRLNHDNPHIECDILVCWYISQDNIHDYHNRRHWNI